MRTEQLFRLFGGREVVMQLTGATRPTVNHWFRTGVPYRHWPTLREAALAAGIAGVTDTTLASTRPKVKARRKSRRNGPGGLSA